MFKCKPTQNTTEDLENSGTLRNAAFLPDAASVSPPFLFDNFLGICKIISHAFHPVNTQSKNKVDAYFGEESLHCTPSP